MCKRLGGSILLLAVIALLGLAAVRPAQAQVINSPVRGSVRVYGSAVLQILPGAAIWGNVYAYQNSAVIVRGGSLLGLDTFGSSTAYVYGGRFRALAAFQNSTIYIYGHNLALSDPTPAPGGGTEYLLTGTLSDGTMVRVGVFTVGGHLVLVPFP